MPLGKSRQTDRLVKHLKRHCMRNPGTDGNLNIMNINKFYMKGWLIHGRLVLRLIRKYDDQVSTYA